MWLQSFSSIHRRHHQCGCESLGALCLTLSASLSYLIHAVYFLLARPSRGISVVLLFSFHCILHLAQSSMASSLSSRQPAFPPRPTEKYLASPSYVASRVWLGLSMIDHDSICLGCPWPTFTALSSKPVFSFGSLFPSKPKQGDMPKTKV